MRNSECGMRNGEQTKLEAERSQKPEARSRKEMQRVAQRGAWGVSELRGRRMSRNVAICHTPARNAQNESSRFAREPPARLLQQPRESSHYNYKYAIRTHGGLGKRDGRLYNASHARQTAAAAWAFAGPG
jgi:hypothetical protein